MISRMDFESYHAFIDHLHSIGWTRRYFPTGNGLAAEGVWICPACSAWVESPEDHIGWHDKTRNR